MLNRPRSAAHAVEATVERADRAEARDDRAECESYDERKVHHLAFGASSSEICAWIRSRFALPWFLETFSLSRATVSAGVLVAGSPSSLRGRLDVCITGSITPPRRCRGRA